MRTRIKELRARYDLTQEDLAKKVGVRRETIIATLLIAAIIPLLRLLKISPSITPSIEVEQVVRDIWIIGLWIFIVFRCTTTKKVMYNEIQNR